MLKRILSIDGGGCRGIIPTMALVALEEVTGKLTRETFSFVAGTSTGALITAAVAAGIPATSIRDVYRNRTQEIFSPTGAESDLLLMARGYRYGVEKLHKVITDILGDFGAKPLNEMPIDILLTAKARQDGHAWYFVKDNPGNAQTTGKLTLADCATASAAAPVYFDPYTMANGSKMVDGGLGVTGNPVYQACVEAFEFGAGAYNPSETVVVSLGTGRPPTLTPPCGNVLSELQWVLDVVLDAPEEQQTELAQRHYQAELLSFDRFDIDMSEKIAMDSAASVPQLEQYGVQLAKQIDWKDILRRGS